MGNMLLANNLKALRNACNLTQKQLAEFTGLTIRRIYTSEHGTVKPDIETLFALSEFFGIAINRLLNEDITQTPKAVVPINTDSIGSQIEKYRNLKKMTKAQFAKALGVTPAYISLIEHGKKLPKMETFIRMLNILDAPADDILRDVLNGAIPRQATFVQCAVSSLPLFKQRLALDLLLKTVEVLKSADVNLPDENETR